VKHDFTDEPAAGFYQSGAAHLRLGKGFHHNRLSLIASISAWGAPDRHAPLWDRRRMMATATRLLYTDRVSVQGLLGRTFALGDARALPLDRRASPSGGQGRRRH
jgi:hypothetical protein